MDFEELATCKFQVSDALDPACRSSLASIAQTFDIPAARPSMGQDESASVETSRKRALTEALAAAWRLVQSSNFDIQVLCVLMRLLVEVEGIEGTLKTLQLAKEILPQHPGAEQAAGAQIHQGERSKKSRQWNHYFDAVFAQIHDWFARHNELRTAELGAELAARAGELRQRCHDIDQVLVASKLRTGGWMRSRDLLELLTKGAAVVATEHGPRVESTDSNDSGGATTMATQVPAVISDAPGEANDDLVLVPSPESGDYASTGGVATLQVSPRFWELQRSIAALDQLLRAGQFEKASIIVADLEETLRAFSVPNYFPSLFAPLFELVARYAEPLLLHGGSDSGRASALMQLYRSDLNRFLKLTLEEHV